MFCQKSPGKSRYPELMYKTYCLYPQGYSSAPSMFNRGCLLAFRGKEGGFSIKKFHYTWPNTINSTDIKALLAYCPNIYTVTYSFHAPTGNCCNHYFIRVEFAQSHFFLVLVIIFINIFQSCLHFYYCTGRIL